MKQRKEHLYVNFIVLGIAALVFAGLKYSGKATELPGAYAFPVYKCASEDCVSIQCILSWDAEALDGILEALASSDTKMTFAVSGGLAASHPETIRKIAEQGHEIAVMGMDPDRDGDAGFIKEDVERSLDIVEEITGERPLVYYCGTRDAAVSARAGAKLGIRTVLCTVDLDTAESDAGETAERLRANLRGGSIISALPTRGFAEALPFLIEKIKNMGFDIVPTHKMLYNYTDKV